MENSLTFNDIKLLLKQKKNVIFIVTLISVILFGAYAAYTEFFAAEEESPAIEEVVEEPDHDLNTLLNTDAELLSDRETAFIEETLLEDAYSFRVYIEHQDGSVYDRSNLLEELLLATDLVTAIEEKTSVEIEPYIDYFLDADINSNNVIYTITIGLGDEAASEEVSNAYYTAFQNNDIDIISSKVTKLFDPPERVEGEEPEEETVSEEEESSGSIVEVVMAMLTGAVLGLGIGIFVAFAVSLSEKKVTPIYNYRLSETDAFINFSHLHMDKTERFNALMHAVSYPVSSRKLIVTQDEDLNSEIRRSLHESIKNDSTVTSNVSNVDPGHDFDELIMITENRRTDKRWYIKQKNQLRTYNKPLEVVKFK